MKLLEQSRKISTSNRKEADRLIGEAEKILDKIKVLEENEK